MVCQALCATVALAGGDLDRGLTFRLYELAKPPERIPALAPNQTPNVDRLLERVDLATSGDFGEVASPCLGVGSGWIELDAPVKASFRLTSDDGARLRIGEASIIDHDGRHGASAKTSAVVELAAGRHPIRIDYFDAGGKRSLRLEWDRGDGRGFAALDATVLRSDPDLARVVSPGVKAIVDDRRPGDGKPVAGVHPGFEHSIAHPPEFQPRVGAMAFLPDGRLVVGTFDPLQRDEEKLPDIQSKKPDVLTALRFEPYGITTQVVARDLYEPCGLCVVGDDLYVAHRLAITRLSVLGDSRDGVFNSYQDVAKGWEAWNYHQFTFGLVHRDRKLYATLSTAMAPPAWEGMGTNAAPNGVGRGAIIEVDLTTHGEWHMIAGGVRTPNGIGLGPQGTLVYCDNQGTWFPASTLSVVEPGRFYGHYNNTNVVPKLADRFPEGGGASVYCDRTRTSPAVWFPQNECGNSPTQPLLVERGPWTGHLLVGDVTQGGLHRVALERVAGVWQGVVLRCTQGLECGSNRLAWGPDGALYVGGIGAGGNWNWQGTRFGLDRLAFNGRSAFEILDVDLVPGGFDVRLSKPATSESLGDPTRYEVRSWSYTPTAAYGGPKIGERAVTVRGVQPNESGDRVRILCDGLAAGTCVHLRVDPVSTEGEEIWSTDAWYTINRLAPVTPHELDDGSVGIGAPPTARAMPLVGRSAAGMFVPRGAPEPANPAPRSQAELLALDGTLTVGGGGPDQMTKVIHRDLRAHLEWRSADGKASVRFADSVACDVEATPNAWHALDVWFEAGDPKHATLLRYRIDGGEEIRPTAGEGVPPKPLVLVARPVATEFRNVWMSPLKDRSYRAGPWQSLASDPAGSAWELRGGQAIYRLDGDTIIGESVANSPNTFLATRRSYRDFELLVDIKQDVELNSGIQVRSELDGGPNVRGGKMRGYQVELDPSDRAFSAGLYDEARRGWLVPLIDMPYARSAYRKGEWNHIRVLAEGPVIRTWINGIPAATLLDEMNREGFIGLQVHGVGDRAEPLAVMWRNPRIRVLEVGE